MAAEFNEEYPAVSELQKYYTPKMIRIGTFLGGPIAAGYFIGQNYKAFGQGHRLAASWLFAILATFVLAVIVAIIPDNAAANTSGFRYLIPLIYSAVTLALVNHLQSGLITEHVNNGGINYGWGRVILISLIGCVISLAMLFGVLVTFYILTTTVQPVNG